MINLISKVCRFEVIILAIQLTGCSASEVTTIKRRSEVEIAPGKWLTLERASQVYSSDLEGNKALQKNPHKLTLLDLARQFGGHAAAERSELMGLESAFAFEWNGKHIKWRGAEIPITLREHGNDLYMVGFNRRNMSQCIFTFFKLNKSTFEEIKAKEFPGSIATQNMWLSSRFRYTKIYDSMANQEYLVDEWKMLRTLDILSPAFDSSFTAKLWYQIETGTEYWKISNSDLTQQFLQDYVAKYKPIALPTIVKEPAIEANANVATNEATLKAD